MHYRYIAFSCIVVTSWDSTKMSVRIQLYSLNYFSDGKYSFGYALFNTHQAE